MDGAVAVATEAVVRARRLALARSGLAQGTPRSPKPCHGRGAIQLAGCEKHRERVEQLAQPNAVSCRCGLHVCVLTTRRHRRTRLTRDHGVGGYPHCQPGASAAHVSHGDAVRPRGARSRVARALVGRGNHMWAGVPSTQRAPRAERCDGVHAACLWLVQHGLQLWPAVVREAAESGRGPERAHRRRSLGEDGRSQLPLDVVLVALSPACEVRPLFARAASAGGVTSEDRERKRVNVILSASDTGPHGTHRPVPGQGEGPEVRVRC